MAEMEVDGAKNLIKINIEEQLVSSTPEERQKIAKLLVDLARAEEGGQEKPKDDRGRPSEVSGKVGGRCPKKRRLEFMDDSSEEQQGQRPRTPEEESGVYGDVLKEYKNEANKVIELMVEVEAVFEDRLFNLAHQTQDLIRKSVVQWTKKEYDQTLLTLKEANNSLNEAEFMLRDPSIIYYWLSHGKTWNQIKDAQLQVSQAMRIIVVLVQIVKGEHCLLSRHEVLMRICLADVKKDDITEWSY